MDYSAYFRAFYNLGRRATCWFFCEGVYMLYYVNYQMELYFVF